MPAETHTAVKANARSDFYSWSPGVTLSQGDCLERLNSLKDESVDFVVTDPPYFLDGLDNEWKKGSAPRSNGAVRGLPVGMKFDPNQGKRLQRFMTDVGNAVIRVMKPGAFAVIFSQPRLSHRMAVGLEDSGLDVRDMFAWHYTKKAQFKAFSMDHFVRRMDCSDKEKDEISRQLGGRKTPQLRPQFECMVLLQKPRESTHINNWLKHRTGLISPLSQLRESSPSTVMEVEKPPKEHYNGHLTVKPVALIEHLLCLFSEPGQQVLDPFLGSGTTAVACIKKHRKCIGIEIKSDYLDIVYDRLSEAKKEMKMSDTAKDKAKQGQKLLEEAVLEVLQRAHLDNECLGAAEISRRTEIFREGGIVMKGGNDNIAWGILAKLWKDRRVEKCPQNLNKPERKNGWKLSEKEIEIRLGKS